MHAVWAMLLGAPLGARVAEAAAGATLFLFAPLLAMTVYGWARERGADRAWATAAALVIAWIPSAYEVAASAYVDLALAGYTALAVRAVRRWSASRPTVQPAFYDGVLVMAFICALPVLAWALWRRRLDVELRLAVLVSAGLFVFWLFSSQQLRYLLPAAAGLAVAIAVAGSGLERGLSRPLCGLVVAGAALGLPVVLAWFLALDPARVVLGGESREAFLARRLDYYPYYQGVNRHLPPTARVWLIDMRRDTYHLDRPAFSDFIFEDYTLTRYVRAATSVHEIRDRVRADGITHLLVRHDILLDYDRSPIVDERRPRQENVAKLELMTAFFTQGTRVIKGDQKFWLLELPLARPR